MSHKKGKLKHTVKCVGFLFILFCLILSHWSENNHAWVFFVSGATELHPNLSQWTSYGNGFPSTTIGFNLNARRPKWKQFISETLFTQSSPSAQVVQFRLQFHTFGWWAHRQWRRTRPDLAIYFKNILQPADGAGFDVHAPISTQSYSMLSCAAKHTAWLHVSRDVSHCPQSCCRLSLHLQSVMHNQAEPEEKILGQ